MNRIVIFFTLLLFVNISIGQHLTPADKGSSIEFIIKNFGINVKGSLHGLSGSIIYNAEDPGTALFDVLVDVKNIHTGINQRDNHLRSSDYFDTDKYQHIRFVSSKITKSTNEEFLFVFGLLTIKDITKEISFPFKVTPQNNDLIFEGSFSLDRRDYHVGGRSLTMSDSVKVNLKVLAKKE